MSIYLAQRGMLFVPTLFLVSVVIFILMRVIPGDPALLILDGGGEGSYTQEDLDALRRELGTERNIFVQYASWIGDLFQGDLGTSLWDRTPVSDEIKARFPVTISWPPWRF